MTKNPMLFYWQSNPAWYRVNEKGKFELTEEAPEKAKESFKLFCTPRSEIKCPFDD